MHCFSDTRSVTELLTRAVIDRRVILSTYKVHNAQREILRTRFYCKNELPSVLFRTHRKTSDSAVGNSFLNYCFPRITYFKRRVTFSSTWQLNKSSKTTITRSFLDNVTLQSSPLDSIVYTKRVDDVLKRHLLNIRFG